MINNNGEGSGLILKSNMQTVCDTLKEYGGIDCIIYLLNGNNMESMTFKVDEYFNELESKGMTVTSIQLSVDIHVNSQQDLMNVIEVFNRIGNPGKLSNIFALEWMSKSPGLFHSP